MILTFLARLALFLYGFFFHLTISISNTRLRLSFRYKSVLSIFAYKYQDHTCDVYIGRLDIAFFLFPHVSRLTGGQSFAHVSLYDFRVHVHSSEATPLWLERLRRSLIFTVLNGTTLRLDDLKTTVTFKDPDNNTRVVEHSKGWHIHNTFNHRMYAFGRIDGELRRNWDIDYGALYLLAQNCRWTLYPADTNKWHLWQIFHKIIFFLPDIVPKIIDNPLTIIDLFIDRCEVTFAHFRLRDAELLKQGGIMLKINLGKAIERNAFEGFSWDIFMDALIQCVTSN
ncbi:hypothetical protein BDZ89DRAFT_1060723 [Hymenopellis radicata]|nr:hypothetical protein BDZ89DRAFT_1060723 [Hymenopellis radicata]